MYENNKCSVSINIKLHMGSYIKPVIYFKTFALRCMINSMSKYLKSDINILVRNDRRRAYKKTTTIIRKQNKRVQCTKYTHVYKKK